MIFGGIIGALLASAESTGFISAFLLLDLLPLTKSDY